MARALSNAKVYHRMTGVFFEADLTPTGTVATGSAQYGDTVTLTAGDVAAMGLVVGDFIRIGPNGSTAIYDKVEAIAAEAVTVYLPFHRAVAIGELVTKLSAVDLGATDENGVAIETTQDETELPAGTQLAIYLTIPGPVSERVTFAVRDFERENVLQSVGVDETNANFIVTEGVVRNPNDFISLTNKQWRVEGLLEDNTAITILIASAKVATANQTLNLAFGQATVLPYNLKSSGVISMLFGV